MCVNVEDGYVEIVQGQQCFEEVVREGEYSLRKNIEATPCRNRHQPQAAGTKRVGTPFAAALENDYSDASLKRSPFRASVFTGRSNSMGR